jgi:pheromone shutdown-related protein TraB
MKQTVRRVEIDGREIILVGTAHISKESIDEAASIIRSEHPDRVCVELDEGRLQSISNDKGWQELDITKVLKDGKGFLLIANLILSSFQKRMGDDVGVKPGDEMKEAIRVSTEENIPTSMVDRPIQVTLQRAWAKNNLWGKAKLMATLLSSAFANDDLSGEDIENLKEQGAMDGMMEELAKYLPTIKEVLIDERDRYLASRIWDAQGNRIVAILGAGHLPGTEAIIRELAAGTRTSDTTDIASVPPKSVGSKIAGWAFPSLIVALLAAGFFAGGAGMSGGAKLFEMLFRWLLWNGTLAALGTAIALGHPLAILTAFLGAPVATINPLIGVGLFSGLAQAWVRKPQVRDMEHLSTEIATVRGFYKNRISHVLLIFFLSSMGGAIGNFIAVPALIGSLFK